MEKNSPKKNQKETPRPAFMRRAILLAKKGEGAANPNPLVGAVLVKNKKIIGEGWHKKFGGLHAEREALLDCEKKGHSPAGATLYVTLEPCCHFGKQPPCTQAILQAGIKKVVVGSADPNPLVFGGGVQFLREHEIQVEENFLQAECDALNFIFFHFIKNKTPYVALKYAMTADGKIATCAGQAKWISCEESRKFSHELRNKYACILAGIGTVLADDPLLTCRIKGAKNPVRVICDSALRIPLESKIVQSAKDVPTIIACGFEKNLLEKNLANSEIAEKIFSLQKAGAEILFCGKSDLEKNASEKNESDEFFLKENPPKKNSAAKPQQVDLRFLMEALGKKNLDSVLIEGGSKINFSALQAGIVRRVYCFVAPKIFGGEAPTPVGGSGVEKIAESFFLAQKTFLQCGSDILIEYEVAEK